MLKLSLLQSSSTILITIILFILLIVFYLLGFRIRKRIAKNNPEQSVQDLGQINSTLLGLLALLLAFTFSMSNSRYDTRRQLVIEEANNIGTVILRTDIYPDSMRVLLRGQLKEYVEVRIAFYQAGMDIEKTVAAYIKGGEISSKIWSTVASYAKTDNITTRTSEMIPALNAMIDITTTRRAAGESTIPDSIMYFLFILCLCSAFLLGYDHKNKFDWIVVIGFAIMLSATVFTIIDMDRPRSGLIDMDKPNQKIIELREMFK
jgi:isoprenylcysteine carboxyl methyltransferase (ICMT) family protein YpbQ